MEDKKPNEIVEEYKRRISDLIDEAEKAIGYPIETCEIENPLYSLTDGKYHRNVCLNKDVAKCYGGKLHSRIFQIRWKSQSINGIERCTELNNNVLRTIPS